VGAPSALTSGTGKSFEGVLRVSPLSLSWDPDAERITILLERGGTNPGVSGSTMAEINTAITSTLDAAYNLVVSDLVDSALGGTVGTGATILGSADTGTFQFDGGSDEEALLLDADLLASTTPTAQVYVSYKALQVGLSAAGASPTLLDVSEDNRESLLGVASTENPLSLMAFYGLTNSPGRTIKALGVGEVTATKPSGTLEAYVEALSFLEGYDVYCIVKAPVHDAEVVGGHVAPRVRLAETARHGLKVGHRLEVVEIGRTVDGTVGPLYGVEVLGFKAGNPFVLELDGTVTGIGTDWNDLIDVGFTVYRAGTAISQPADQAEVIAQVGEGYADRRMFHHWPDKVTADVQSVASIIDGYYAAAGWGGKQNVAPAQQPFSRTTLAGFTGVKNSNGYFSKSQLDRIAGGGTWITYQESQNAPLRCRHQLSTDVSSVEKREFSITRIIDYTAKFLRTGLNKQVGNFNITQSYLDAVASSVQGLGRALRESGVLLDFQLVSINVNDVQPDKVDIVVAVDVPYPANYIELTIQV